MIRHLAAGALLLATTAGSVHSPGTRSEPVARKVLDLGPNHEIWRVFDAPRGDFLVLDEESGIRIVKHDGTQVAAIPDASNASVDTLRDRLAFLRSSDPAGTPKNWDHQFVWTVRLDPVTGTPLESPRRATIHPCIYTDLSPDGSHLLCAREQHNTWFIYTLPTAGGDEHLVLTIPDRTFEPVWSRDGKWIYYSRNPTHDVSRGERVPSTGGSPQPFGPAGRPIGVSGDGRYIAVGTNKGPVVRILDRAGKLVQTVQIPGFYPSWSTRAPHALVSAGELAEMTLKSIGPQDTSARVLPALNNTVSMPHFTPDGRHLVYLVSSGDRPQFVRADADGANARLLPTHATPSRYAISPDSRWAAFAQVPNDGLYLLNLASGSSRSMLSGKVGVFAWTEDSRAVNYVKALSPTTREIRRVGLDGNDVRVGQVGTFGLGRPLHFVSDSIVGYTDERGVHMMALPSRRTWSVSAGHASAGCLDCDLAVSPDHRWIGFELDDSTGAGMAYMASLDGKVKRPLGQSLGCGASVLGWHPNGRDAFLYGFTVCDTNTIMNLYVTSLDGGAMRNLTASEPAGNVGGFSMNPDGSRVVYTVAGINRASIYTLDVGNESH